MTRDSWAPSDEDLVAFDQGRLADDQIDAVTRWLEANPDGEDRLRRLTEGRCDPAVDALRQPRPPVPEFADLRDLSSRVVSSVLERTRPPSAAEASVVPVAIREYQIVRELGKGGMGAVYLGWHPRLQRHVAIKLLSRSVAADPWFRQRFEREMALVGPMDHPNLVRAHDAGQEGDTLFLVMELLDGRDLGTVLRERGPLPIADACELVRQAAVGLQYAHQRGMVHRDVKPTNLFLTQAGVVKLIDLGLARVTTPRQGPEREASAQYVVGTPDYMAPEQWIDSGVDARADLYALGGVLFCLLAGKPPFAECGDSWVQLAFAHQSRTPSSLRAHRPEAPRGLDDLVARLLAKETNGRPRSAAAVAEALTPFTRGHALPLLLAGKDATQRIPSPAPVTARRPPSSRTPLLLGAGAVALAVIVAAVVFLWPTTRGPVPIAPPGQPSASLPDTYTNSLGMAFVRVPRGRAWLGGGGGNPGSRVVDIPADFYLGTCEVTQEEWRKLMGSNPSGFARTGADREVVKDVSDEDLQRFPVETVSWVDVQRFLMELNRAERTPGWTYRLPTVNEWEYACRGGPMADRAASAWSFYLDQPANEIQPDQANYLHEKGLGRPRPVGSYRPNRLGLHDMYGNVSEWCDDVGRMPEQTIGHIQRGGAYWLAANQLNSGVVLKPSGGYHDVGLRVARVPVLQADPHREDFDAWRNGIASLSADEQVIAVTALLRARNPAFCDQVTPHIVGGVVTELSFFTDNVTDLEPVRALTGLRVLRCGGSGGGRGALADLGSLRGMTLTHLECQGSLVSDLTPLAGMPLQVLNCGNALVTDLGPLRGLPLRALTCDVRLERDAAILRTLATLERINDKPIAAFWQGADAKKP